MTRLRNVVRVAALLVFGGLGLLLVVASVFDVATARWVNLPLDVVFAAVSFGLAYLVAYVALRR